MWHFLEIQDTGNIIGFGKKLWQNFLRNNMYLD